MDFVTPKLLWNRTSHRRRLKLLNSLLNAIASITSAITSVSNAETSAMIRPTCRMTLLNKLKTYPH